MSSLTWTLHRRADRHLRKMLYETPNSNFPPLFRAVGCICIHSNELLLLKRALGKAYPGYWGLPSGKVHKGEDDVMAMVRELYEETGVLVSADNLSRVGSFHIITEMSFIYIVFVYLLTAPVDVTINPREHTHSSWFSADEALSLTLVPHLADCLRRAVPQLFPHVEQLSLFVEQPSVSRALALLEKRVAADLPDPLSEITDSRHKRFYVSFGPPASGKSSALKAMHARAPTLAYVADSEALRRGSRLNFYLKKLFEDNDPSFFFRFQIEALVWRFRQTLSAPNRSLVDETIFSTYAYSRALLQLGLLASYEYQTFFRHYALYRELLPRPTAIFYFTASTRLLIQRIRRRSRSHERFYSGSYVTALREAFASVARELEAQHDLVRVDTSELSPEDIASDYGPSN